MKTILPFLIVLISLGCTSCQELDQVITSNDGTNQSDSSHSTNGPSADYNNALNQYLNTSHPLSSAGKAYANVPYGNDPKNKYDLILPTSVKPDRGYPLVIFFHGGGFIQGNKNGLYKKPIVLREMEGYLESGIAVANVNYRLLVADDSEGLMKCLSDAQHALQSLKMDSPKNGVDPSRIVLRGTSAGASISLWIALQDDQAEPESLDPILRQSTKVAGAVVENTQSTLDVVKWEQVLSDFNYQYDKGLNAEMKSRIYGLYGMTAPSGNVARQSFEAASESYREQVDFSAFMDVADPPIFVANKPQLSGAPSDKNTLFHHREHAHYLETQANEVGGVFLEKSRFFYLTDPSLKETMDFVKDLVGK
jgi:hypothetical protein